MSAQSYISEDYRDLVDDRAVLAEIRGRLDSEGVVELTDFLTPDAHALLKRQILELESNATSSSAGSNQKYALKGEHLNETVVGELARSDYMLGVVNGILEPWIADDPIRADEIVPGINIMRGPGDVTAYHFDGTYLNMILPVVVPKLTGERRGQLTATRTSARSRGRSGTRRSCRRWHGSRYSAASSASWKWTTTSAARISSTAIGLCTESSHLPSLACERSQI